MAEVGMAETAASTDFSAGGVVADSRYYAGAVEALRSACAQVGEAADAAQRAGFFSDIADWNDEADASAHDAHKTAVMAMAEALRAKEAVAAYADAARRTLAEVTAAFAMTDMPESPTAPQASPAPESPTGDTFVGTTDAEHENPDEEDSYSGHLADALVALAQQRESDTDSDTDEAGYVKMAKTLTVLADARTAYRDVDETLIMLDNARNAYREASEASSRTALAADIKATLDGDIRSSSIGEFRSSLTALAVTRTAYNAEVANGLWGALAEARTNLAAATATVFEIQAAAGDRGGADDLHAASALAYSFGDSRTPAGIYDTARDVVVEAREFRRRAQSACDAVDALLVENRAVAADALIEARAAVGAEALGEIRAAYDVTSDAMDALFGARAAFEVGFDFTLPEIFGDSEF